MNPRLITICFSLFLIGHTSVNTNAQTFQDEQSSWRIHVYNDSVKLIHEKNNCYFAARIIKTDAGQSIDAAWDLEACPNVSIVENRTQTIMEDATLEIVLKKEEKTKSRQYQELNILKYRDPSDAPRGWNDRDSNYADLNLLALNWQLGVEETSAESSARPKTQRSRYHK